MKKPSLTRANFAQTAAAGAATLALTRPAFAADLMSIEITVTHYPGQDYAMPVVIGEELGYMSRENIHVASIVGSEGGGTTVRNISQGGLILGEVATPAAIKAILAGEDLKIIGGGVQTAGTISWSVKKDSPIKTIHDFVGKTVGFTNPGSASESLLKMSLTANNIDPATVKMKAAGGIGENLTLLNTGGLDVAFTVDPSMTQHKDEFRTIFYARDYVPGFLQSVWVAGSDAVKNKKPLLAGFMRAWARAVDYTTSHPIDAANRYARATKADPRLVAVTLGHEQPTSYFGRGQLNQKSLANIVASMRLGKVIGDEKVALAKLVDQSALATTMRTNLNVSV